MPEKLLSIIIPLYNEENNIASLLECFRKQNNNSFEIIVVDDGSTDNTYSILKNIEKDFENLVVFKKNNEGSAGLARNFGLKYAVGEYIYFCDADDLIDSNLISTISPHLDSKPDILIFNYRKEILKNNKIQSSYISKLNFNKGNNFIEKFSFLMNKDARLSIWNKVIKRKIIIDNSILFPKMKRAQDMFFFINLSKHINSWITIENIMYFHKSHFTNSKFDIDIISNHITCFKNLDDLLINNDLNDAYVNKMFISWFCFVIPFNIIRNSNMFFLKKIEFLSSLLNNNYLNKTSYFQLSKTNSLPNKFILVVFNLKLKFILFIIVYVSSFLKRDFLKLLFFKSTKH